MQKDGSNVRAGIAANGELDSERFRKLIADQGGHMAIIQNALDAVGVTQQVEEGSGVLRSVQHNADTTKALKENFKWPR
ncbi:hypothetical protein A2130_01130 [Candidatus Woesebacteria bacterium GWC2_33_12]|uniref:Uncharacterized protein n=1 Tax=Candidatus Woesebacteria bacterium GW2011_GWB1_33_22 TaxID=1618566 RepID=A0A0G0A2C6_9BACT|nr:MAG: hypothetical protein UR29_C0002G0116 [Candidatus Woesebacteria bacterium GW2011_GWC2_33_12]KKP42588.1 MAG: hypothetical protein UR33_C0002G0164 [Candidatus Woesebacteria bacterium GW2011_GWA2_33_20]KKP45331.1 MAG: hypothetical protein UR35_C0002G0164 [Candidatus Woesebacteria bacterium GW2011_GWB1_33_22]KKP47159.1 MAG: hypothetical protein UR37_C0002G0071 [Microgenomates group bacterium GW2011_GWC1_33_28]KKP51001.1 MAG: hypothetical protein UR41_C0002G0165 [Candidatus Woesebacteria bact